MRVVPLALVASLMLAGCGKRPRDLRWDVDVRGDPGATAFLIAEIRAGGCGSSRLVYQETFSVSERPTMPPRLTPQVYGFAVRVTSPSCMVVLAGCSEVTLPLEDGEVVSTVVTPPGDPTQLCDAFGCLDGICVETDGGTVDDGGVTDADAMPDSAPIDTAPPTCGDGCNLPFAMSSCVDGACVIDGCTAGYGDCDGVAGNGCETRLSTNADCGGCGTVCNPANATGDCLGGTCDVAACDMGYGDCDGSAANGCETSLRSNSNCGGCGVRCNPPDVRSRSCSTGVCRIQECCNGFADCDGNAANGCETSTYSVTNCGGCGMTCGSGQYCCRGYCESECNRPYLTSC